MKKSNIRKMLAVVLFAALALAGCGDPPEKPLSEQDNPNGAAFSRDSIPQSGDAVKKWIAKILPAAQAG